MASMFVVYGGVSLYLGDHRVSLTEVTTIDRETTPAHTTANHRKATNTTATSRPLSWTNPHETSTPHTRTG